MMPLIFKLKLEYLSLINLGSILWVNSISPRHNNYVLVSEDRSWKILHLGTMTLGDLTFALIIRIVFFSSIFLDRYWVKFLAFFLARICDCSANFFAILNLKALTYSAATRFTYRKSRWLISIWRFLTSLDGPSWKLPNWKSTKPTLFPQSDFTISILEFSEIFSKTVEKLFIPRSSFCPKG